MYCKLGIAMLREQSVQIMSVLRAVKLLEAKPAGYKRLTEIIDEPVLFKGGVRPSGYVARSGGQATHSKACRHHPGADRNLLLLRCALLNPSRHSDFRKVIPVAVGGTGVESCRHLCSARICARR